MKTVNWDNYNNDITSSISDIYFVRGFEPMVRLLADCTDYKEINGEIVYDDPELQELAYGDEDSDLEIITQRAISNRYNMFF